MIKPIQILGIVVFAVGALLLGFAYHASNAPLDQFSNVLTGRYSNQTMWYVVCGAAAALGGAILAAFGKRI